MRSLNIYKVTICFLITLLAGLLPNYDSKAQSPSDFPVVVSTELFPFDEVEFFTNDLHYYFTYRLTKSIVDTTNSDLIFRSMQPGSSIAGWSKESSYLAFEERRGDCLVGENEGDLVIFNAMTSEISRFCLPSDYKGGVIKWSPFDEYHLALIEANQGVLLDVRTQELVPFTLSGEIDIDELDQLVGYDNYLWNPTTGFPEAWVRISSDSNPANHRLTRSVFEACTSQCFPLLDVLSTYPSSGSVFEFRLWNHWLVWALDEFVDGIPYTLNSDTIPQISDTVVYVTDLRTLASQPLFRFSSLHYDDLLVTSLGLSPDGSTIALPLRSIERQEGVEIDPTPLFDIGSVLLHLNWPTSPDKNPTGGNTTPPTSVLNAGDISASLACIQYPSNGALRLF